MIPPKSSAGKPKAQPPQAGASELGEPVTLEVVGVLEGKKRRWSVERPTLLMPIESAIARIDVDAQSHTVDRSLFLLAPEGARVQVQPQGAVTSVAVLGLGLGAVDAMLGQHHKLGVEADQLAGWWASASLLPRTVWVHEIVHRYVFERHALDEHESQAARFLEVEIVKELYFLFRDRDEGTDRATLQQKHSPAVERAVAFIEDHLFERHSVKELAWAAGVSESALLRAFRREVGATPAAWWRRRKLDGALDLVRSGRHTVAEIAEQVGYENPTAFGEAFRRRFGRPPSAFKPQGPIKPAP